jgi:glycosyltransferase involved in cell wall biosynthesis
MPERLASSDSVVCVSEFARRSLIASGVPEHKLTAIYDGVDVDWFSPGCFDQQSVRTGLGLRRKAFVVLLLARCVPQKRHDLAIAAAALLRDAGTDVELVFAGAQADPEWKAHIHERIRTLSLEDSVHWLSFQQDVRPLVCAASALILPSDREALGTCVLEAMALQRPVIVSDAGGSAELVEHRISGLTMRGGDPQSLFEALLELAEDPELARALALHARTRVCSLFSLRRHADAMARALAPTPYMFV